MSDSPRGPRVGIKGPLVFSAILGAVAFVVVLFSASGGTSHGLRYDLAAAAFGIAFIVSLVFAAMMSMSYKENAEHLGHGDGVNLRSEDRVKRARAGQQAPERGGPEQPGGDAPEGGATSAEGTADTPEGTADGEA